MQKTFASLLVLALAAVAVQAEVQPTPAPYLAKRQATSSFDPYNLSQYTDQAAISSLSSYIAGEFSSLTGQYSGSIPAELSSALASQQSQAYGYLSMASAIVAGGGATNSAALASFYSSIRGDAGLSSLIGSGSAFGSAASATSSKAGNGAVGGAQLPAYVAGMTAVSFVAVIAGTFML